MSKMKPCKTCSKEVAKSAKSCPHCGAKLRMGFFPKFLLWVVAIIVVIIALVNMSGGKKAETTTAVDQSGKVETKSTTTPTGLSKEGVSSDVKIVVDSFETKNQVGDNEFTKAKAQGIFKVLKVTVTNNQKDAITLDSNSFKLIDDQKREFTSSSDTMMAFGADNSFFLKSVNPGLSVSGFIAFDVPKDAKGFVLQARGGMTGKSITLKVE
jgi:hypothetical protein